MSPKVHRQATARWFRSSSAALCGLNVKVADVRPDWRLVTCKRCLSKRPPVQKRIGKHGR